MVDDSRTDSAERLALLFDRSHRQLYRLALRMSSDDEEARDLVQDAFLRAARNPSSVPTDADHAHAWLVRVVVNLCKDRYRRRRVRRDAHETLTAPASDRDHGDAVIVALAVRRALSRLSPRRRAVIVLHELEGMAPAEVARILGITSVTVRWHLAMARKDLAAILLDGSETRP